MMSDTRNLTQSKPDVADLQDESRYVKLLDTPISDMMPFLVEHLRRKSWVTISFYSLLLLVYIVTVGLATKQGMTHGFGTVLAELAWAVAAFVVLIPLHELIHGATFKFFGARDVRYTAVLKKLMFFAGAHNFVVGTRAFAWVAVMPFLVISLAAVAAAVTVPGVEVFALAVLTIHTLCCGGDFALLNYLWLHRGEELYTYDDMDARRTYFYAARAGTPTGL